MILFLVFSSAFESLNRMGGSAKVKHIKNYLEKESQVCFLGLSHPHSINLIPKKQHILFYFYPYLYFQAKKIQALSYLHNSIIERRGLSGVPLSNTFCCLYIHIPIQQTL